MGPGCESVSRSQTDTAEIATGVWKDGRVGTFRGVKKGKLDYGSIVFGSKGVVQSGGYDSYKGLVDQLRGTGLHHRAALDLAFQRELSRLPPRQPERLVKRGLRKPTKCRVMPDPVTVVHKPAPRELTRILDQGVRTVHATADDPFQATGQGGVQLRDLAHLSSRLLIKSHFPSSVHLNLTETKLS